MSRSKLFTCLSQPNFIYVKNSLTNINSFPFLENVKLTCPQVRKYASKSKKRKKEKIMPSTALPLADTLNILKAYEITYPDRTLELHVKTKLEKGNSPIRGSVSLPKPISKKVAWLVFARGKKAEEAKAAGAHTVGAEELIAEIAEGNFNVGKFDKCLSTPELYPSLTKIARILGPKMLMPMVKRGTVTNDIIDTIKRMDDKLGFNSDKLGWIHTGIGKISWTSEEIQGNIQAILKEINELGKGQDIKRSNKKADFIEKIAINPNMGESIHLLDFKDLLDSPSVTTK
ncbi:ribosomal protein L1-like protein [Glomus cerebriforme]|uniref:Ribosomal protein L1-like protein n=1 Tax=Glomus cerebriforme TaxID=658196 RepID=A0A397TGI7_9GLOM|nr:ribosomal protein L1-like protein [Glomus cerebriforme]